MRQVEEIMTKHPACCTPEMSLVEVAQLMLKFDCGEIPVVYSFTEKKILGVITDRDICTRAVAMGLNPLSMNVEECMSYPAISVKKTTTIADCCLIMEENQIRRLPVVDEKENCCGMVSLADVVRFCDDYMAIDIVKNLSAPSVRSPYYTRGTH